MLKLIICGVGFLAAGSTVAQIVSTETAAAAESLKGVWIVKIGNEPRTRTLVVGSKVSLENGETVVDGQWGFSDGGLVSSKIFVSFKAGKAQAKVETPTPTALNFELRTANSFEGQWLNRAGKMVGATGQRFDPMSLAQATAAAILPNKPIDAELKDGAAALPDLKTGDTWRYLETDKRTNVKTRDIERRLTSFANGQWSGTENGGTYNIKSNLSLIESPNSKTSKGERNDLVFPIKIGTTWAQQYGWSNLISGSSGNFEGQVRVLSYEKVKTPAGEFDAFKIQIDGFWNNATGQNGKSAETLWYAPAVRNVVQREYEDQFSAVRSILAGFSVTP